jgi:predicted Zn-dependent protease
VGPVIEAVLARGMNATGALTTAATSFALASSEGIFACHPDTYANFTCTVRTGDWSGWCDRHRRDWRELDPPALGASATTLIERGVARAVVHDRRTARIAGVESTGHAGPPPSVEGPIPYDPDPRHRRCLRRRPGAQGAGFPIHRCGPVLKPS